MKRDIPEPQFAELDEQIRAALQLDIPAAQIDRLEQFWRQRSRADRWKRYTRRGAVAAAILVAVAALWHQAHTTLPVAPQQQLLTQAKPIGPEANPKVAPDRMAAETDVERELSISSGRPATAYEQLLFTALARKRESMLQSSMANAVENVITCLVREPDSDVKQLLASDELKTTSLERLLLRQLSRSDDGRKRAIMRLLAVFGTSHSTVPLLKLSRREVLRAQALEAIQQTVGTQGLANAATQTDDARVRAAIYQRLFGDVAALDAYLTLIRNDALRDEVLTVADEVAQPILDALLTRLNAEDPDVRLAAALVLGHANGPIVTRSLIALVAENPSSPDEAWIALMACRGQQADQFLAYATHQPRLLGPFNRARVYWARIIH